MSADAQAPALASQVKLGVEFSSTPVWSYAYTGTRRPIVRDIRVSTDGRLPDSDFEIAPRVRFDFPLSEGIADEWIGLSRIVESRGQNIGRPIVWERAQASLKASVIGRLREHIDGHVTVDILDSRTGDVLATSTKPLRILAANQWIWESEYADAYAAFVIPGDPFVAEILKRARELLGQRTGDSSTQGYQSEDPRVPFEQSRARKIAESIYDAICTFNLSYSDPPAGMAILGQRIRTPSQIKDEGCGTCLDTSVLLAACFAEAGLEPVLVLVNGHAFAGYLTGRFVGNDSEGNPIVGSKAVRLIKAMVSETAQGSVLYRNRHHGVIAELLTNQHLQLIETTTMTSGARASFEAACLKQNNFSLQDDSTLEAMVLVSLAWRDGITPPVVLGTEVSWVGQGGSGVAPAGSQNDESWTTQSVAANSDIASEIDGRDRETPPRVRQWKASLLDLGPKNPLLKIKKKFLEVEVPPSLLGAIDDQLFKPKKRLELVSFEGVPFEWIHSGVSEIEFEKWMQKNLRLVSPSFREIPSVQRAAESEVARLIEEGEVPAAKEAETLAMLRGMILANFEKELRTKLSDIKDEAKETMLETGVNSLYLALGSVEWIERKEAGGFGGKSKTTETHWRAPLYLYPVILEGGRGSPHTLRLDPQGEVTPNYCLHEKLRREPYKLDLPELVNPEEDEFGLDFDKMLQSIRGRLQQAKLHNFAVKTTAVLGVFDYSTFRLWKDLDESWKQMAEASPVARHLMLTPNQPFVEPSVSPESRLPVLTPIAADDSQREAIQWALDGKSFRLEGPPGTGKSQTITNLLASSLAHGKKVLFVAEKQTALDAVKKRLDACGLGDFCLNLHAKGDSDTRMRKNISEALTTALDKDIDPEDEKWEEIEYLRQNLERRLNNYKDGVHGSKRPPLSPWSTHEDMLELGDGELEELPLTFVDNFVANWTAFRAKMQEIADQLDAVGDPRQHMWRFVSAGSTSTVGGSRITKILSDLLSAYQNLESCGAEWVRLGDGATLVESASLGYAVDLESQGLLPGREKIAAFAFDSISDDSQTHRENSPADREAARTIAASRALAERLAPALVAVSDLVMNDETLAEAKKLVDHFQQMVQSASVSDLRASWQRLSSDYQQVSSRMIDQILLASSQNVFRDALRWYDDLTQNDPLRVLARECEALRMEAKSHEANVAVRILGRNDHMKIGLLLNDLEEASMLNRRRRSSALRECLEGDALIDDDRLLVLSLKALLALTPKVTQIRSQITTDYRGYDSSNFEPWNPEHVAGLTDFVSRQRISDFKLRCGLQGVHFDGDEFVSAVRTTLELARVVADARSFNGGLIGAVRLGEYQPWMPGEYDRFVNALTEGVVKDLRHTLAAAAVTTNDDLLLEALTLWFENHEEGRRLENEIQSKLLPGVSGRIRPWILEDVHALERAVHAALHLKTMMTRPGSSALVEKLLTHPERQRVGNSLRNIARCWGELSEVLVFDSRNFGEIQSSGLCGWAVRTLPNLVRDAGAHDTYVELSRWIQLRKALDDLGEMGLASSASAILYEAQPPRRVQDRVRRSGIRQMLRDLLRENELDRFDRKEHDRKVSEFEAALKATQTILKSRIPGLVNRRRRAQRGLLTGGIGGATQSLLKGLKPKRGDRTPIRDLIEGYGAALSDALPCFLMSPDSVARLVPVGSINFDLVVFDEASQIRTSHAIGSIGRAKACVVVGDSRQMPPATAFSSNTGTFVQDDDENEVGNASDAVTAEPENVLPADGGSEDANPLNPILWESAQDAESILEEFEEADLPYLQLLCHYRSRDEVLIAFSNNYIYEQPMLTFPSIYGLDSLALQFVHVENGRFNRGEEPKTIKLENIDSKLPLRGTNLREAEELVEEVLRRLRDPQRRRRWSDDKSGESETIIVVTFNVPQMKLVTELLKNEDMTLYDEATSEGEADEITGHRKPPRLKIRNLENVQVDEADAVIFSVAFSRSAKGTFPMNWGPVTQTGGERRLNVAVTRARREMMVFCSFHPEEMTTGGKALSRQGELVQRFLKLAVNGPKVTGDLGIGVSRSRHIENLATALRQRGYRVQTQLGLSRLRVDIAVSRLDRDEWELAILADDPTWAARGSAFQRDILPKQVLPGLGWKRVLRVWLPAWVNEPQPVLEEIDAFFRAVDDHGQNEGEEDLIAELLAEQESEFREAQKVKQQDEGNVEPVELSLHEPFVAFEVKEVGKPAWLEEASKSRKAKDRVSELVQKIIDAEGPIELDRLAKLACNSLGFTRVPADRLASIKRFIPASSRKKDRIGTFCWRSDQDSETWPNYRTSLDSGSKDRAIHEISVREFSNALVDTINRVHSIEFEEGKREVARIFGFKSLTAKTDSVVDAAFDEIIKSGRVVRNGDDLRLP
jgi:hypothetical protein